MLRRIVYHDQPGRFASSQAIPAQAPDGVICKHVAVQRQKWRLPEQAPGVQHATCGFQRRLFKGVANGEPPAAAIATVLCELRGQMGDIDHHIAQSLASQPTQVMLDEGQTTHSQQRLGRVLGQRAHPLADTGSQDHDLHPRRLQACASTSGRMSAVYQSRKRAIAGSLAA